MNAILRPPSNISGPTRDDVRPWRLLIVTDAWRPQVNGVVRTLEMLGAELTSLGVNVAFLTPERFRTVALPSYPEIRLALASPSLVAGVIETIDPMAIHIATEGPLGLLAAWHCRKRGRPYTTCFHTRFPEYLASRLPIPIRWSYSILRRFHNTASGTMVATPALALELKDYGFQKLRLWRRGIDLSLFLEATPAALPLPRPIHLYVGRIAVEKNLDAFLRLDLAGSKVVVGDGPSRAQLQLLYPQAHFLGRKSGADLASLYAAADVFVFPSKTDTFGLVMLEALASGTPVAAFPVSGPQDVVGSSGCGCLDVDLERAISTALHIDRNACRRYAASFSMRASAVSFLSHLDIATGR